MGILRRSKPKSKSRKAKKKGTIEIPIREIGNNLIETVDGHFKMVLSITDTINSELLSDDDLLKAIEAIQLSLNAMNVDNSAQILISSEQIDITDYFDYLEAKLEEALKANDKFIEERVVAQKQFLQKHSINSRNVHNFYLVLNSQLKRQQDAHKELLDMGTAIMTYLQSGEMGARIATEEELTEVCYQKLNPNTSATQPYTSDMDIKSIHPPSAVEHSGRIVEMDGKYHSFYTFSNFPDEVSVAWLKRVTETGGDLDLSITLRPSDKTQFIKSTNSKIIELESRLLEKVNPMYRTKYERQRESLEKLLEEVQRDTEHLFNVAFVICIKEDSIEELKSAEKRLETSIGSSRLRSKKIMFQGNKLIWYLLPICYTEDQKFEYEISWPMQSTLVSSILPFNSSELNFNEGVLKGLNAKTESPVFYDRYNNAHFNNPNEVVFGESGSGKSYYIRLDMLRQSTMGGSNRIFVIDPEREYFLPNAQRITFRLGSEFTTNPFHIRSTVADIDADDDTAVEGSKEQYLHQKIAEMISFFEWILPNITSKEKAYLLDSIQKVYEKKGVLLGEGSQIPNELPTLSDLYQILEAYEGIDDILIALNPYVSGPYANMFNGQTNWDMKSKVTIFDIHELSDEVKRPLMDLLLKEIWEEMKTDRTERKGLYVDEAWLLADENNQQTMKFLREIAKRIRKYGGFITTATQNVDDFLTLGKYGTGIFNNAFIKTFMKMSEKDVEELSKFMKFSDKELVVMGKQKQQGYCIHVASGKRIEMKVISTPDDREVLNLD